MSTHVACSGVAERLPAMWGSATLATEVSSTSMKVPSITEIAMRTGLVRGRHSSVASADGGARRRAVVCHLLDGYRYRPPL